MKKRLKLVVLVSLITLLIIPFVKYEEKESNALALLDYEEVLKTDEVAKELEKTYGKNYKEVLSKNYEASEKAEKITNNMMKAKSVGNVYPDYYGGMYINDDQDLVIKIVKNKKESEQLFVDEEVLFEYVENSYNELEEVNNIIVDYFSTQEVRDSKFVANYVDIYKNKVIVELENNTIEEQEWIKKNIIDSTLIEFKKGEKHIATITYNAGAGIDESCSIGYRAKLNGVEGFITAGHCFLHTNGYSMYGTKVDPIYVKGKVDAAFVKNAAGVSITNNLQKPYFPTTSLNTKSSAGFHTSALGVIVVKLGYVTGITTGKIINLNVSYDSYEPDGTKIGYLTNQVETNALCNNGDSGGVVFSPGNNLDKTGTVLGIVQSKAATSFKDNEPRNMYYSRADLIQTQLGITRY